MANPSKSIGYYKITFENGATQYRHLILQEDFLKWSQNINSPVPLVVAITEVLYPSWLNDKNSFFTTNSPLGQAIKTGLIVGLSNSPIHVEFELLN